MEKQRCKETPHRFEHSATIVAPPQDVFDFLDDPERIGAHMSGGSPMMLGGAMRYRLDAGRGREVGSVIRIDGRMLGLALHVEEVITERVPPVRKIWQTAGYQKMIVIQDYRMGFETHPAPGGTELRGFIDYTLPQGVVGGLLGLLAGPLYARWCVTRIVDGTRQHFAARRRG